MGKSILIITLGVSLIIGFVILKLNTNSTSGVETTMNKFDQTHARLIANSGIEIFLEKLKLDPSMMGSYNGNSLFNGIYDITIAGPDSHVTVTSVAHFLGVNHTSIAEARTDGLPPPDSTAALYLNAGALYGIKKQGTGGAIQIDGNDHDINGGLITPIVDPKYGIGVDGPAQDSAVTQQIKDQGLNQIKGREFAYDSTTGNFNPSVGVVGESNFDWDYYARQIALNPDYKIPRPNGLPNLSSWGTVLQPKVTLVNAAEYNLAHNDKPYIINASDVASGCGILLINGSVAFKGNFTFKGLVIAYKQTELQQDVTIGGTGTVTIIGSLVAAGEKINMSINGGTLSILYSGAALSRAASVSIRRWEILSWWE
jgi:hypothetical protein